MNSSRGNNFYDASQPDAPGYTRYTNAAAGIVWSRTSATWEPSAADKGAIARALFYLTVRYTGDTTGEPQLTLTDNTNLIVSGSTFMGRYTTLLKWHFASPVTAAESNRNDQVYWLYQTNRNPFVDHPEWVAAAFLPRLTLAADGNNVLLTWTNDYPPNLVAEATTNLTGVWQEFGPAPVLTNNTWTITEAQTGETRFYRLRLQSR